MPTELLGANAIYDLLSKVYSVVEEMQRKLDSAIIDLVGSSTCGRGFVDLLLELEDIALRRLGGERLPGQLKHPAFEGHTVITIIKVDEFIIVFCVNIENKCILITPSMRLRVKAAVLHPQMGIIGLMEAKREKKERLPVYIF